jgi:HD-GYP domain-containing protein (c-di-GMP phosphodiesterase class II)
VSDEQQIPAEDDLRPAAIPSVVYSYNQLRRGRELLARFYGARRACRFYPEGHPAVEDAIAGLHAVLESYFNEGVDVVLTFFDDELLLGEQLLAEESVLFDQLVRDMTGIGAGSVVFQRGIVPAELSRAMAVLSTDPVDIASAGGLDALVRQADLPHMRVAAVTLAHRAVAPPAGTEHDAAEDSYRQALELMRDLERVMRSNGELYAGPIRAAVRSLLDNVLNNRYAMLELTGLRDYDEYTFFHSVNVTILSLALGAQITRDQRFLSSLGVGALMHDIGKTIIDVATLNKPGALSTEEWNDVRKHPVYGAEQAARTPGLDKASVVIILEHHMRYDTCGYPERFPVRQQRLASRIVSVADAFDAMTSKRSYSAARLPDEAISILAKNAGTAFDPRLVRLFVDIMGCYPPRSVVRLTSGEVGVVLSATPGGPTLPKVRLFADPSGAVIEPFDVDLADPSAGGREVERCLDATGLNVEIEDFLR